ncbi:hypothetical protein Ahy_A04g017148 isoform B [Arachis hypogaea]|uniref:Uncharacterized protein n=1 Tax=Arachis hypogaea TaxID=3818 RepID=A0A445DA82_ARAHY|nr:hypothetical protein Ahy_A04g017148 isoform B [Arachis hypogaea]
MCEPLHSAASFILFSSQYSILRFSLFFANPITSFSSIPVVHQIFRLLVWRPCKFCCGRL